MSIGACMCSMYIIIHYLLQYIHAEKITFKFYRMTVGLAAVTSVVHTPLLVFLFAVLVVC